MGQLVPSSRNVARAGCIAQAVGDFRARPLFVCISPSAVRVCAMFPSLLLVTFVVALAVPIAMALLIAGPIKGILDPTRSVLRGIGISTSPSSSLIYRRVGLRTDDFRSTPRHRKSFP
jgi:hypothetical protein